MSFLCRVSGTFGHIVVVALNATPLNLFMGEVMFYTLLAKESPKVALWSYLMSGYYKSEDNADFIEARRHFRELHPNAVFHVTTHTWD